jgi:hypothetical protein
MSGLLLAGCATLAPYPPPHTCRFNTETLTFEVGDARAQARCLLRHVGKGGVLGPELALPSNLERLVGQPVTFTRAQLAAYIEAQTRSPQQAAAWKKVADDLDKPVSRAWDNRADAPEARYFVIHDTSEPYLDDMPFPKDLNHDPRINDFSIYFEPGKEPVAHFFNNRLGEIAEGHDFSVPWRATKRERSGDKRFKGLFVHIENVQPRRRAPGAPPKSDTIAPRPGFTKAQYETLALLYAVISVREGRWLVPGFHSAVDEGIADKHDDPQNFDVVKFDRALGRLVRRLSSDRTAGTPPAAGPPR